MSVLFSLALRNVVRNARRSVVTLCAIALGVLVVVVLKGGADGFIALVVASVVDGRTGALQVHRKGYFEEREALPLHLAMPRSAALEATILGVPGVKGLAPRIHFAGLLSDGASQANVVGTAIDPALERRACPNWGKDLLPGSVDLAPEDRGQALLGVALAASLKATPGGAAHLTLSASSPGGRMNALDLEVKGVTETMLRFENKRQLTVPLAFAQALLGLEGQVTEYAVAVEDLSALDQVAAALRERLGPEYEVQTWRQAQPYMFGVVRRQEGVVLIAGVIFFLAIATGIANAMATSVLERVREVGTMLAFGMRRRAILALFVLEALTIGAAAGVVGALLGRAGVWAMAQVGFPVRAILSPGVVLVRPEVSWSFTALSVLAAGVVAVVAAALPALKASRLDPVEALRS